MVALFNNRSLRTGFEAEFFWRWHTTYESVKVFFTTRSNHLAEELKSCTCPNFTPEELFKAFQKCWCLIIHYCIVLRFMLFLSFTKGLHVRLVSLYTGLEYNLPRAE